MDATHSSLPPRPRPFHTDSRPPEIPESSRLKSFLVCRSSRDLSGLGSIIRTV